MITKFAVLMVLVGLFFVVLPVVSHSQDTTHPQAATTAADDANVPTPAQPIQKNTGGQLTFSGLIVLLMDYLKKNPKFQWLSADSPTRNRIVAIVASAASAFAVHATFDSTAGKLVIEGLTLTGMLTAFVAWGKSFIYQELMFRMAAKS